MMTHYGKRHRGEGDNMGSRDFDKLLSQICEAEEQAWWKNLTHLVSETDRQLLVLGPTSAAMTDDLRNLGQTLEEWQSNFPEARHIWGLSDLLKGEPPRTPPIYLMVPQSTENYAECYEPVALVYVAESTNMEQAALAIEGALSEFLTNLAWYLPPDIYCDSQR